MTDSKLHSYKAVILIGGPQKGTRFRPLSLECPKPLFPIAGYPTIQHHIDQLSKVRGLKEVLIIGFYPPTDIQPFVQDMQRQHSDLHIRYLQEFSPLGTAGGIYHFRDQLLLGSPTAFFVINADVCGDLPLQEMADNALLYKDMVATICTTEATREQSLNYGCAVVDNTSKKVLHYVEKPSTYISTNISCGIYLCSPSIMTHLAQAFHHRALNDLNGTNEHAETLWFERDLFPALVGSDQFYAFHTNNWWSQIKTAAAAIYANRHCLALYRVHDEMHKLYEQKENDVEGPEILGDVYVHPTAVIDSTAKIGPNVSIGRNVQIGRGARVRESIVLDGAVLQEHCCVLYSIIGWNSVVGQWSRVEGTPTGPNPNMPFAKLESRQLFNKDGRLNPSITILGCGVQVPQENILLNSIVLPHKDLTGSHKNQIIL